MRQCCVYIYSGDNTQDEKEMYLQSSIPCIAHLQLLWQKPGRYECCGVEATF